MRAFAVVLAVVYAALTVISAIAAGFSLMFVCTGECGPEAVVTAETWQVYAIAALALASAVAGLLAVGLAFADRGPGLAALGAHAVTLVLGGVVMVEIGQLKVGELILGLLLILGTGAALNYVRWKARDGGAGGVATLAPASGSEPRR